MKVQLSPKAEKLLYRARRQASAYTRFYRYAGSGMDHALPDFLIVGAMKCGTSSLFHYLCQHPGVLPPVQKEIQYFTSPNFYRMGEAWYRSHFPTMRALDTHSEALGYRAITGEATPAMVVEEYPENAAQLVPRARLVMILRDPVERAYSHFQHTRRNWHREPLSFWEALQAEPQRTAPPHNRTRHWPNKKALRNMKRYSYIQRGKYIDQIEHWLKYYPREQLHIVNYARLQESPAEVCDEVSAFCGLPPHNFTGFGVFNKGGYTEPMEDRCREFLTETFRASNRRLFDFLGQDWQWPS